MGRQLSSSDRSSDPASVARTLHAVTVQRRRRWRSRDKFVILFLLLALAAGVVLSGTMQLAHMAAPTEQPAGRISTLEMRTGIIISGTSERCHQTTFDNDSGRMLRTSEPCKGQPLDRNGVPIPAGTAQRLNSISKSFQKP
jgi:hypothetical protein